MKKKGHKGFSRSKLFSSVTTPKEGRKRAEKVGAGRGRPTLVTQQPAPQTAVLSREGTQDPRVVQERGAFSRWAFGGPLSVPTPHASASNWGLGRHLRKAPIGCQDTFPSDPESPRPDSTKRRKQQRRNDKPKREKTE